MCTERRCNDRKWFTLRTQIRARSTLIVTIYRFTIRKISMTSFVSNCSICTSFAVNRHLHNWQIQPHSAWLVDFSLKCQTQPMATESLKRVQHSSLNDFYSFAIKKILFNGYNLSIDMLIHSHFMEQLFQLKMYTLNAVMLCYFLSK